VELIRQLDLTDLIRRAIAEDVGQGDITTAATVKTGQLGKAIITVKEPGGIIFCGGLVLEQVLAMTSARPVINSLAAEGVHLHQGAIAADIEGQLAGLLMGERTALTFLQLMSGIATITRRYVDAISGTRARIIDTRKTHPGLRAVEKYAVRMGGGTNHRFGLDSGVLIKENHITAAGGIAKALEGARRVAPHSFRVQIECETLEQVREAIGHGASAILLDNMSPAQMREARAITGDTVILEASGGVTLETVRAIAESGVDLISVGALTHSARAIDLSMRIAAG
jgi:nicotinate-nucleotide pyrophosphorylase (carboxylating)